MYLWIQCMLIRVPRAQCSFDSSSGLFAVFHALHRLLAPRHPPHALSSLAALIRSSIVFATTLEQMCGATHPYPLRDKGKVTILTLSKGSCRDSLETAKTTTCVVNLAHSCECNSYRYR